MRKLLLAPILIGFACILAGLYGAVHDQISYTISPEYFTKFKFIQFSISPELQNRLGAAFVGWMASWWMGGIIGIPVFLSALPAPSLKTFVRIFLKAAILVTGLTLLIGLIALMTGFFIYDVNTLPPWMVRFDVSNPVAFARVGNMHNFAYLGGFIGLICGCIYSLWQSLKLRKNN